ncbi:prolipodiacylglyceryl transferase family protein [Mycobacterium xenopi 3993]|nr:prolipodiacylglyceryl transferase family protein [Mycobacterium xenopi 3993]
MAPGPIPIRAYALFIIAGIVVALLIGDRRWAARGGERGVIYDIALWAVPFGLVGGRLYHLITDWRTYFGSGGAGLVAALRIWDGGLGIWGAVALGGVGAWIGCRRRGIPLPAFADAVARVSCSHRPSAGSGTISTRNFTAARPPCRGAWKCSTGAIHRDSSTCIPSTGCRPASWRWWCSRRSSTNCCGTSWYSSP